MLPLPNVILIILDSARRDAFGCYGSTDGVTPEFDRLAREGALLWDHQAAGSGSAQAHVSTFSGQHSARHRMVHNLCEVGRDLRALPLLLRELGYRTFGHSKASFIPPAGYEDQFGFDEMLYPGKAAAPAGVGSRRDRLLDRLRQFPAAFNALKAAYRAIAGRERQLDAAARYFDGHTSFRYLRDRLIEWKGRAPVFAYATILHPHTPYFPPRRYRDRVLNGRTLHPQSIALQYDFHGYLNGNYGDATEGLESLKACYLADLLYGDEQIGSFVRELSQAGVLEGSILIVTSDHGELFGEHGYINHGATVWKELFETPCLIRYPDRIPAGTVVNRLTSALDLVPTVFDLIDRREWLDSQTVVDGRPIDFSPGVDDRMLVLDSPPAVLPERFKKYPNALYKLTVLFRAVRTTEWKYLWQSNGERRLFKVGDPEDPAHDRLTEQPAVADRLHAHMERYYTSIDPGYDITRYPVVLSRTVGQRMTNPVVREELRRLGYL